MNTQTLSESWTDGLADSVLKKVQQAKLLANTFGACFLDGQPARLEMEPGQPPRIITRDGARSAHFPASAILKTVIRYGGRFTTRDLRPLRGTMAHLLMQ